MNKEVIMMKMTTNKKFLKKVNKINKINKAKINRIKKAKVYTTVILDNF
jgi:hypothetical protein